MTFLFVLLGLWSVNVGAEPAQDIYRLFPVLQCPAVGDEYEKMISKLGSIKAAIKQDANCKNVELQVKGLEDLVIRDREEVMTIMEQSQNQSLNQEQAVKVRQYAENVTKKVSALNDLFLRSNQCFPADQADKQLTTLAGFVSEASQLVGALTGPWGAPIALAGNVVAGFMTGLDQVLKSRAGFDFSKREQWTSYVQNLCTYHSYRDQIDHLLNPQAKISQLKQLKFKLDSQIQMMTRTCAECQMIESAFNAQGQIKRSDELKTMLSNEVSSADGRFALPYGTYTLQNLGLRDWVVKEMARIEKEAQSYWSDISGRHLLYRAKEEIEQMLLQREAPRFLAFQTTQSRRDYANFEYFLSQEGRAIYMKLEQMDPNVIQRKVRYLGWSEPIEMFKSLVISTLNFGLLAKTDESEDVKYSWTHFRDQSLMRLRTAQTSTQVAQTFCSFFKHSGNYSSGIRGQCSSPQLKNLVSTQNQIEQELAAASVISEIPHPQLINPDLESSVIYSKNKIEALSKGLEMRMPGH